MIRDYIITSILVYILPMCGHMVKRSHMLIL